jgi:hypothetical protein
MSPSLVDQPFEPHGQVALGDRHADGRGQALDKRAGGGLDSGSQMMFWVPRRNAAQLAEALELVEGHLGIAGEVVQPVKQH